MAKSKAAAKAKAAKPEAKAKPEAPETHEASSLLEEEEAKAKAGQSSPAFKSKQLTENAKIAKVIKASLP